MSGTFSNYPIRALGGTLDSNADYGLVVEGGDMGGQEMFIGTSNPRVRIEGPENLANVFGPRAWVRN